MAAASVAVIRETVAAVAAVAAAEGIKKVQESGLPSSDENKKQSSGDRLTEMEIAGR